MRNLATILILPAMLFCACGTMKKLKEEKRLSRQVEVDERVEVKGSMSLETNMLLKKLTEHGDRVTALIESDSVIVFDPSEGFAVQGGRVLYQQSKRGTMETMALGRHAAEARVDSLAEVSLTEGAEMKVTFVDKERKGTPAWLWSLPMLVGVIAISLLVLRKFKWSLK